MLRIIKSKQQYSSCGCQQTRFGGGHSGSSVKWPFLREARVGLPHMYGMPGHLLTFIMKLWSVPRILPESTYLIDWYLLLHSECVEVKQLNYWFRISRHRFCTTSPNKQNWKKSQMSFWQVVKSLVSVVSYIIFDNVEMSHVSKFQSWNFSIWLTHVLPLLIFQFRFTLLLFL
jgi:hypothetical protein